MKFEKGCGTVMITEPTTISDVLNTLSYGNRVLILYFVGLMAGVGMFEDGGLFSTGIPYEAGEDIIFKHIKHRCQKTRLRSSYCTFISGEELDTAKDPAMLMRILRLNLWDAYCSYSHIPSVAEKIKELHRLFGGALEDGHIPKEAYELDFGKVERNKLLFTTLGDAYDQVLQRTSYGQRMEKAIDDGYILSWSNGAAKWIVCTSMIFKGEEVHLDANEMLLVGSIDYLRDVAKKLPDLPLYANSLEGKMRGES